MERERRRAVCRQIASVVAALVLFLLAWLATRASEPPAPLPSDSAPEAFSAERAFTHVQAIARVPHPIGSEANGQVRKYISGSLRSMGLRVEEQGFVAAVRSNRVSGTNLIATLPGIARTGGALALVCHYDSVATGPGASDDAAGVATLLETARALLSGSRLRNDIVFLFTDGEELGLLGAKPFVAENPKGKEIALALNFEARGVSGPVFMFETSADNGALIDHFSRAVTRPAATSLMYEVYRHMPNDTDLTVFRKSGIAGLNFGFIGEAKHYHAATDDPEHLSLRSLQHEGLYATELAREFGETPLANLKRPDAIYFDLFTRFFVHYSTAWAPLLAGCGTILYFGIGLLAIRTRRARATRIGTAFAVSCLNQVIVALFIPFLKFGVDGWSLWYVAFGLTCALSLALSGCTARWINGIEFALGALMLWLLLSLATAVKLPGGSYLTIWPLLFALLGVALACFCAESLLTGIVAGAPAVVLVAPLVKSFYVALGPSAIAVPMAILALVLGAVALQARRFMSALPFVSSGPQL